MFQSLIFKVALIVISLDQITKWAAVRYLENQPPIEVIGEFFQFGFVRNPGAAFSLGTNVTFVFGLFAILVCSLIIWKAKLVEHKIWALAVGGFLGGAAGNLIDRIFRDPGLLSGHVVDFLALPNYPLFNIADSAVVVSAITAVVLSIRGIEINQAAK